MKYEPMTDAQRMKISELREWSEYKFPFFKGKTKWEADEDIKEYSKKLEQECDHGTDHL